MYKKRSGTSGIRGQLYETKLLSLLLYRARHNDDIEQFHLATNVDDIGAFDDICFRANVRGLERPVTVFIQAKHRENNKALTLNNKQDLAKYFDSYLKIRYAFKSNNDDILFEGNFDETDCLFILYSTAKGDVGYKVADSELASILNDLIGTDSPAEFDPLVTEKYEDFLYDFTLKQEITSLAVQMAKYVCNEADFRSMLSDELFVRYHVLLAKEVMVISDINPEGYRHATFSDCFYHSQEEFITTFKDALFAEVLKRRKTNDKEILESFLWSSEKNEPSIAMLSELIGSVITYNKNGKLEFTDKDTEDDLKRILNEVYVSKAEVDQAVYRAAKTILKAKFNVPAAFGNQDLSIRGNDVKVEKRLDFLTLKIHDLVNESMSSTITIDGSLDKGFLQLNGGIAGAVGNMLVSDKTNGLLKFTDDFESLGDHAKRLYKKLENKVSDLSKLRFEIKVKNFPKLTFDCSKQHKDLVKDFLNKLLLYTNQADEKRVEDILKKEIKDYQCNNGNYFRVTSDAIFLTYHDEIQKWWMTSNKAPYLTKETGTSDGIIKNIVDEPLTTVVNYIYRNKINNIDVIFEEEALKCLKLQDQSVTTIIVTDNSTLTVAKLLQYHENKDLVVLDLEYIFHLPMTDCNALCSELISTSKILIFVSENIGNRNWKSFEKITKAARGKTTIIITNQLSFETMKIYFPQAVVIMNHESTLTDMTKESRMRILKDSRVIFQGEEVSLDAIIDDKSLVRGEVMNKIISKDTITVGKPLGNTNYDEIKHLYVDRRVERGGKLEQVEQRDMESGKLIRTLNDIPDDVVLITAKPGMGKSTLLTHLSLKTKIIDPTVWILRINLLEYCAEFLEWQTNKTVIDTLECLKFLCQAVLNTEKHGKMNKLAVHLEDSDGVVCLKDYAGDQRTVFELKMFFHYYNRGRIIFLFDGFDEICPHYSFEVMSLLKTARSFPRKHKIWIASRSYNRIKTLLQREFGISYLIKHFSYYEKKEFLDKFWKSNLSLQEFDSDQLKNVHDFLTFIKTLLDKRGPDFISIHKLQNLPLHKVYLDAYDYVMNQLRYSYIPLWTCEYPILLEHDPQEVREILTRIRMWYNGDRKEYWNMENFVATPLHLYIIADYFQNEIKNVNKNNNKWNLDINTFTIYDFFLETKLKKIRFVEKNKMDINNPDIMITYDKEQADFINVHKKIAAYTIFHQVDHKLFSRKELKEIKNMLKLIKKGGEKTGLIYSVASNNTPIFIHRSFAEYFAVEYICDLLKNEQSIERQRSLMDFIFNIMFFQSPANVRNILDSKIKTDDALMRILIQNEKVIFDLMLDQTKGFQAWKIWNFDDVYEETKYESSIERAVSENLQNFVSFFMLILKNNSLKN